MKKIIITGLMVLIGAAFTSCKEENTDNRIKVRIADATDAENKSQKLYIDSVSAKIYWTVNSRIKLISQNYHPSRLRYVGKSGQIANFELMEGELEPINYMGFYPENIEMNTDRTLIYNAPSVFTINPSNPSAYISDYFLLYAKASFNHANPNDTLLFYPGMTILELPLRVDSGNLLIQSITLSANGVNPGKGAFVTKARLPNVFNGETDPVALNVCNSLIYQFSGNGLSIGTTPITIKLLVWSADTAPGLSSYTININNDYFSKNLSRTATFANNTYYNLPAFIPPTPQIGDFYQGGIVCSTYIENGQTHGYVCAPQDLTVKLPWSLTETNISTLATVGSGTNNTVQIINNQGPGYYAAYVCDTLSINGYTDWFLPSRDELNMIYQNLFIPRLLDFHSQSNDLYWTSTQNIQNPSKQAMAFKYNTGHANFVVSTKKDQACYVRPMRTF